MMQTAKTRVLPASEYFETHLTGTPEQEEARRKLLDMVGDYDEATAYDDLTDDEKKEIDALNLSEMLKDALAEGQNVDYKEVSFILGRLSALQKPELIPIVLESLERLYPVAHSVASFFKEFSALDQQTREHVAKVLLTPILDSNSVPPSEYYCIWILSLFHYHRDWNYAETLLRIFRETHSDAVRRYAAWRLRRLAPDLKLSRRPSTSAVHRRSVAPPFSSPLEEWVPTKENTCARVCA